MCGRRTRVFELAITRQRLVSSFVDVIALELDNKARLSLRVQNPSIIAAHVVNQQSHGYEKSSETFDLQKKVRLLSSKCSYYDRTT